MKMKWKVWLVLLGSLAVGGLALAAMRVVPAEWSESPHGNPTPLEQRDLAVAVVDEAEHSFGTMDVGQKGSHTFVIRNEGRGVLLLKQGETSCKCTRSVLEATRVPPGGTTSVHVQWKTEHSTPNFRQGTNILTSDPANPRLILTVHGEVRAELATLPESLVLPDVALDEPATGKLLLFSQQWEEFEIVEIKSPLKPLSWKLCEVDSHALETIVARTAYEIEVEFAPGSLAGPFAGCLTIEVAVPGETVPRSVPVEVQGEVLENVTVFGAGLDSSGCLRLGKVSHGVELRRNLCLVVRGKHRELAIEQVRVEPRYLQVKLDPQQQRGVASTRQRFEVIVPADAPLESRLGDSRGQIVLVTNHPQTPEVRIEVEFAVQSP